MLGELITAGSTIAGLVGQGKNKGKTSQEVQGFASLPKEVQDYLIKQQLPKIQDFGETPYATVPYRRAGAAELDPVFGSKALQDLQRLNDQRVMQQYVTPQQSQAAAPTANVSGDTASALEFLTRARSNTHPRMQARTNNIQGADDLSSLAKLLEFYKQQSGGQSAMDLQGLSKYAERSPEMRDMFYNMVNR